MREIGMIISVIVVMVIGVAVIIPVITEVGKDANISKTIGPTGNVILNLFPLFVAVSMILIIVGMFFPSGDSMFSSSDDDYSSSDEKDEDEKEEEESEEHEQEQEEPSEQSDRTKQQLLAEKILKKRYARGEISDEEYTEKMARL